MFTASRTMAYDTPYSERSNLTMRMHNRRFTRLTNALSKNSENHAHMVAIWTVWYNFANFDAIRPPDSDLTSATIPK